VPTQFDLTDYRRSALLLIDFQHDFLDDNGRMPIARNQVNSVIAAANAGIERAVTEGWEIVAVGNEFRATDWLMNLIRRWSAIEGFTGCTLGPTRSN
jgi:maleamate amidohydrolase